MVLPWSFGYKIQLTLLHFYQAKCLSEGMMIEVFGTFILDATLKDEETEEWGSHTFYKTLSYPIQVTFERGNWRATTTFPLNLSSQTQATIGMLVYLLPTTPYGQIATLSRLNFSSKSLLTKPSTPLRYCNVSCPLWPSPHWCVLHKKRGKSQSHINFAPWPTVFGALS